nr:Mur ligase family protein [Methylomarinum sp. Ch1-1]MDP4522173.1 Mur ligase family protein [Methylomarinum sp. Ch1-1]
MSETIMKLTELLAGLADVAAKVEIAGLALDSRQVKPGFAFIALAGSAQHGIAHVEQALDHGAIAVIYDPAAGGQAQANKTGSAVMVAIPDLTQRLGLIGARFYRHPSQSMAVIGVTGTNGKTTCSQFLAQVLPACGVIGTMGWGCWGQLRHTLNTTPDALAIQGMLHELLVSEKKTS